MIHHLTLRVTDLAKARALYVAALAPLGYEVLVESEGGVGLGADENPDLWLVQDPAHVHPMHLAFAAPSRQAVDAFHAAALAAGAKDNGGPGLRAHYHATYYAAFVLDDDGNNIEAVTLRSE
ncbi:MAG TPA: VOC family protein [Anaeromyxobacter sp.]|nr:VOC family protein [Anaeromyxobacter sp.]